jgi:septal ring factor EnvC (AmiA/AmiB activator)
MTLVKRKPKKTEGSEPSEFDKKYDKMMSELSSQTAAVKSLTERIDKLIASDKEVHKKIEEPEKPKEPEKKEEPDINDKKEELTDKIENS